MNETQKAIAELHKAESRMRASGSDPEEPDHYDICVHCSELLNTGAGEEGIWEEEWPCPTAMAAELPAALFEQAQAMGPPPSGVSPF